MVEPLFLRPKFIVKACLSDVAYRIYRIEGSKNLTELQNNNKPLNLLSVPSYKLLTF